MWQRQLIDLYPTTITPQQAIRHLRMDNRQIQSKDVFFACQGTQQHGEVYVPAALKAGAAAVLIEADSEKSCLIEGVPHLYVPNLSTRAGALAAHYYQNPSQQRPLIGITGTNGKTSVNHFIAEALQQMNQHCGVLGTLGYGLFPNLTLGNNTTPDPLSVQASLADFVAQGADCLAMEVSSHALVQQRVAGCEFHTAVFTNLSRDHLDYHGTLENYAAAKQQLFLWQGLQHAIINKDDAFGQRLCTFLDPQVQLWDYSYQDSSAAIYFELEQQNHQGITGTVHTPLGKARLTTQLVGQFNISNLLAALGSLLSLNYDLNASCATLSKVKSVAGRMQAYYQANKATVVIDYAHTPDALAQVLQALRPQCQGELYCVFGCGGDRDQGKRAQMGAAASELADKVIITNDNPRHEQPEDIIAAIVSGIKNDDYQIEPDRAKAIGLAITQAQPRDWILIAGKGHEDYQQIGDQRFDFSDAEVVTQTGY